MNKQGIFITFMVFLLAASVLVAHEATKRTDFLQERKNVNEAAFNRVNNAFNNIYEEVVSLSKEGIAKTVQQRSLPFEYSFPENGIALNQRLPVREALLRAYIDALNIYSIYVNQDPDSDLTITTSTIQDYRWDDTQPEYPDLYYAILPQCLKYKVNNGQITSVESFVDADKGCGTGFNYEDLNSINIDINISSSLYTENSPAITILPVGPDEEYDSANTYPYLYMTIKEVSSTCPGTCIITDATGEKIIRRHFNPDFASADKVLINVYKEGVPEQIEIKVGEEFSGDTFPVEINNGFSYPIDVGLTPRFEQPVDLFYFTGFSISVEKKNFQIKRST